MYVSVAKLHLNTLFTTSNVSSFLEAEDFWKSQLKLHQKDRSQQTVWSHPPPDAPPVGVLLATHSWDALEESGLADSNDVHISP